MASLKDLIVTGPARFIDKLYGNLEGTADRAKADGNGDIFTSTYLKLTGGIISNSIGTDNHNGILQIKNNATGNIGYHTPLRVMSPQAVGTQLIMIGPENSAKKAGYLGFYNSGTSNLNNNYLTLGLYEVNNAINILGSGKIGFHTLVPYGAFGFYGKHGTTGCVADFWSSREKGSYIYFGGDQLGSAFVASVGYYEGLACLANEKTYARIGVTDAGKPNFWNSPNPADSGKYELIVGNGYLNVGPIKLDNTVKNNTRSTHYISAGSGYSTSSGLNGIKLVATEQEDAISGIGQDCTGKSYELSIAAAQGASGEGYITFVGHKMASLNSYKELGHFNFSNSTFYVNGKIGIGTAEPSYALHTIGDIYASGNISANGIGAFKGIRGETGHVVSPGGGRYTTTTGTVTGYLKITLPVSWTNCMLRFIVDIYDYSMKGTVTYVIGGYNYSSDPAWHNISAYCTAPWGQAKSNLTVRFGHDGSKCAIYIGESNTSWSFPQVIIRDVVVGYGQASNIATYSKGWSIGFTTSLGSYISTVSNTNTGYSVNYANSAAKDSNGNTISSHYINKNGGAMSGLLQAHGGISLNSSTPQETPLYILGIRAFADGGNIIWQSTNNVSVGHATSAGSANTASKDANGNTITSSYLRRYDWWASGNGNNVDNLRAGTTFAYTYHNAPTTGTIVAFDCSTNENYGLQIMGAYQHTNNHLYFRNRNGDINAWGEWRTILDNSNYTDYTVTKTGVGASGTNWGISITGNAATATKATQDGNGETISSTYLRNDAGFKSYSVVFVPSHTTTGWYRVACIGGLKGYFAGFVTITGNWHNGEPSSVILTISGVHNTPAITQIGGTKGSVFSQVRLTGVDGLYYLELYCEGAYGYISNQYVTIYGTLNVTATYSPTTPNGSDGSYTAYAKLESKGNMNFGSAAYAHPQVGDIWLCPLP